MSGFLQQFSANFAQLNAQNPDRLGELYAENAHFTDPLHEICGLAELHLRASSIPRGLNRCTR
ncbi:nuclear transport factor 2 family protein [Pseudomonas sp. NPDC047963]|nr:nuclear transport factor 2 family protein [Pseudomonas sp.]